MADLVTLVNEQDEVIGQADKYDAHRNPAKLHRAISVYLFNNKGELLLQKRSAKKIVGAHQWANTCCGNVWPGESYEECAKRRLQVELGINDVEIEQIYKFIYAVQCNEEYGEHEMDVVFIGRYEGEVTQNKEEVADVTWMSWEKLINNKRLTINNEPAAPWFKIMLADKQLVQQIENWKRNN